MRSDIHDERPVSDPLPDPSYKAPHPIHLHQKPLLKFYHLRLIDCGFGSISVPCWHDGLAEHHAVPPACRWAGDLTARSLWRDEGKERERERSLLRLLWNISWVKRKSLGCVLRKAGKMSVDERQGEEDEDVSADCKSALLSLNVSYVLI